MKKVIKKSILMVVMLTTLLSNANEGSSFIPKKEKDIAKTMVTINDVRKGQELVIKDKNGFVLYKELINKTGIYSKTFDLTELPNGNYFFEVEKDMVIETIPFNVTSNKVTFEKEKEITIFKPNVRLKGSYIYLDKLALNKEPLDVKIYYSDELIYSEIIKDTKTIHKAYKLSLNQPGEYKMVLTSNGREYNKYIKI